VASSEPIGGNILIVEDDDDFRSLLAETLGLFVRPGGVRQARSGEEALLDLAGGDSRPSLICIDVHLGGMNGLEMLRRLKASLEWADVPVVVLSGSGGDEELARRALRCGAVAYLPKTHDLQELAKKLVEYMSAFRVADTEKVCEEVRQG
jgi:CheY-like chemotaxis protein